MFSNPHSGRDKNQFETAGSIRLHRDGENVRCCGWIVTLKLIATCAMLIFGLMMVIPSIPLPPIQAACVGFGTLLVYIGAAYFIRPEPNYDNLGNSFGRNDRFQISDNINRSLLQLHMFLGPGRFVSETFINAATLVGIVPEKTHEELSREAEEEQQTADDLRRAEIEMKVAQRHDEKEHSGTVQLDSLKYYSSDC